MIPCWASGGFGLGWASSLRPPPAPPPTSSPAPQAPRSSPSMVLDRLPALPALLFLAPLACNSGTPALVRVEYADTEVRQLRFPGKDRETVLFGPESRPASE